MTSHYVNYGTRITLPSPAVHKKDQLQVRIDSQRLRKNEVFLKEKNLPELLMFSCRQSHVFLNVRHITSYSERRLRRMVGQNGGKFERF